MAKTYPTSEEILAVRTKAGLTQKQAGALLYASENQYRFWELGQRKLAPGLFELFLIKTGQHDKYR